MCWTTELLPTLLFPWQLEHLKDWLVSGSGRVWCGGVVSDDCVPLFLGSPRSSMASPVTTYEPSPRLGPFTAYIGAKLYIIIMGWAHRGLVRAREEAIADCDGGV